MELSTVSRERSTVTLTSSNGTVIGAFGLCTVTCVRHTAGKPRIMPTIRFGQLFNQIDVFAFDDGHDAFGDRTIVDGVVQIVGTAGGSEVEEQRGVHHEGLGPLMLEVEHAMFARRADSRQSNLIPYQPSFAVPTFRIPIISAIAML